MKLTIIHHGDIVTCEIVDAIPNMGAAVVDLLQNAGMGTFQLVSGGYILVNFAECVAVMTDGG